MKLVELLFIKRKKVILKDKVNKYFVELNGKDLDKIEVYSNSTDSATYKELRSYKTPQYDTFFLLRKKKGFNTYLFNISWDVIVAEASGKVIDALINVKPGHISKHYKNAFYIYFCTIGTIKFYGIEKDSVIRIRKDWLSKS